MRDEDVGDQARYARRLLDSALREQITTLNITEYDKVALMRESLFFVNHVEAGAVRNQLSGQLVEKADVIAGNVDKLPVGEREVAFKCVASYHTCKSEAGSIESEILCGIALIICFVKELVPDISISV